MENLILKDDMERLEKSTHVNLNPQTTRTLQYQLGCPTLKTSQLN